MYRLSPLALGLPGVPITVSLTTQLPLGPRGGTDSKTPDFLGPAACPEHGLQFC